MITWYIYGGGGEGGGESAYFGEFFKDLGEKKGFEHSHYNTYEFWKEDHNKDYQGNLLFYFGSFVIQVIKI